MPRDEPMREALIALRDLRGAYEVTLDKFDHLIEHGDPGFDPDPIADFDERSICMEHLGSIRRGIDDLVRMLAAAKGKHALAELVAEPPTSGS